MTVRYSEDVASFEPFRFVKLLFRWRGSFYKLIVREFAIYFAVYMFLNVLHSFILTEQQDVWFTEICTQLGRMSGYVVGSVIFCLGFFIQQVYKRFCYTFHLVPFPDSFAFLVSVNVHGNDNQGRMLRRTMVRYVVASIILTWMNFSERMQVLFPDLDSLILGGFLTKNEVTLLKSLARPTWRQLATISWASAVVKRARLEGRIEDDYAYNSLVKELDNIRQKCARLTTQNNTPIPLAYFHTVLISVYSFFSIAALAGSHRLQTHRLHRQLMSDNDLGEKWLLSLCSELITLLQFSICAGVLAISRSLMAPFGMEDDNIDVEEIVTRHLSLAYLVVDELHSLVPEISDSCDDNKILYQIGPDDSFKEQVANDGQTLQPGFVLSFAPSAKIKHQQEKTTLSSPAIRSSIEARNKFLQKRSVSKLERLLTLRKMN